MNLFQNILHEVEEGRGRILMRIVPLLVALLVIGALFDSDGADIPQWGHLGGVYHGLNDAQSMDNAQLARQISRGGGYKTQVIRPYALTQLGDYQANLPISPGSLFPAAQYPPGTPRLLPDTYNPPGYPYLLAAWFKITQPHFDQTVASMGDKHMYSADRFIPLLNQLLLPFTGLLVFVLGWRLFDERVAWMSMMVFFLSNMVWQFSVTTLSTTFLMFLTTGALYMLLEIFRVSERSFDSEDQSQGMSWLWGLGFVLFFCAACLTRLHVLVLLIPIFVFLKVMPRSNILLFFPIALCALAVTGFWFWRMYLISGNPLGSNMPMLIFGQEGYSGDQIFRSIHIPTYERIFRDIGDKEYLGFRYHFEHAWELMGSSPMILLFAASLLHTFKRRRAQAFRWLIVGCAFVLIGANNVAVAKPDVMGPWNTVVILFPAMIVVGSAFFFVLLDRLNFNLWIFNNAIVTGTLLLSSMPLLLTLAIPESKVYNYPPYYPPFINYIGQLARPEEWVTSDMPWATAWYADRSSLWLPDSLPEFQKIHDNINPTGVLLLTPVTLDRPALLLTSGEDKDWLPFFTGLNLPAHFPLDAHTSPPTGGPEYAIWSDSPRWQK